MSYPNLVAPQRANNFHVDAFLPGGMVTHHEFETFEQVVSFQQDMQLIRTATAWVHPELCTGCGGPLYAHDRTCAKLPF